MLKNTPESDKRAKDLKILDDAIEFCIFHGDIDCVNCANGNARYTHNYTGETYCEDCVIHCLKQDMKQENNA